MSVESCEDTMRSLGCEWAWQADDSDARLTIVHGPQPLLGAIEGDTMSDCARKFHDLHAAAIETNDGEELVAPSPSKHRGVNVQPGQDIIIKLWDEWGIRS